MSLRIFRAIHIFLPVNASLHWLYNVSCLILLMNWRFANTVGTASFFKGWTEVPHSLWRCRHGSIAPGIQDYYWTTVNITWRPACLIQDFMECDVQKLRRLFLCLIVILRQFRIIRYNQQAALKYKIIGAPKSLKTSHVPYLGIVL